MTDEIISRDRLLQAAEVVAEGGTRLLAQAIEAVRDRVTETGAVSPKRLNCEQHLAHGLSWLATYVESIRQLAAYAVRATEMDRFGPVEQLIVAIGLGEYCAQILGGIAMSQGETIRLRTFGLPKALVDEFDNETVAWLLDNGNTAANRAALVLIVRASGVGISVGDLGLDDTLSHMRSELKRFCDAEIAPHAHRWHLANDYIPMTIVAKLSDLGVFGLTLPEALGGVGLGKEAMCVATEELSRAYIGVGSLGTRSEIASELILAGGSEEQKQFWIPRIASGDVLPTAVFTEPDTGSNLAALRTRALKDGDVYRIHGNKTWITHAARADLMTLLVRTDPGQSGYKGLSLLLAEKPRGTDEEPFPVTGLTGSEIPVLGYRGMKEYELAFDGFAVDRKNLLGEHEGQGFRQLMQTFESARIQTAARAVGVAQNAFDLAWRYAEERVQFGEQLIAFPRVADKLAMMAVEIMIARQLTYYAARQKDLGRRCDGEAGMAKLLSARIAWAAADNALQIHGGNGFALEYPVSRLLCDARILNIFEGAAEIQAHVIARRLLEPRN